MQRVLSSLAGRSGLWLGCALAIGLALGGCGTPSRVNVQLRKEKQSLEDQVEQLTRQRDAALARIEGLEQRIGTVPTLPEKRLEEMFTVHGVEIGRLTCGFNSRSPQAGDEGVRVHVLPVDATGDALKATGNLTIEVFDLANSEPRRIASCQYSPAEMKKLWRDVLSLQAFVVTCPWQIPPSSAEVVIKVRFEDALTGRRFSAVRQVTVKLGGSSATRPS